MRLLISAALLVALFGIGGTGIDSVAAQSTAAVPVKFSFVEDLLGLNKITSDGLGVYENGKGVSAVIDPSRNGELIIYSVKSGKIPHRRFTLTFNDCIGTCFGVPPWTMPTGAQFIAGVRQPDGSRLTGGLLAMPLDTPGYRAGFKVYLGSIDNVAWSLCMTPSDSGGVCQNSTSTGSTPAHIMRTTAASWTIWADPGPRPVLASGETDTRGGGELFTETSTRRSTTIANQGKYAMPFSMTVCYATAANCP